MPAGEKVVEQYSGKVPLYELCYEEDSDIFHNVYSSLFPSRATRGSFSVPVYEKLADSLKRIPEKCVIPRIFSLLY